MTFLCKQYTYILDLFIYMGFHSSPTARAILLLLCGRFEFLTESGQEIGSVSLTVCIPFSYTNSWCNRLCALTGPLTFIWHCQIGCGSQMVSEHNSPRSIWSIWSLVQGRTVELEKIRIDLEEQAKSPRAPGDHLPSMFVLEEKDHSKTPRFPIMIFFEQFVQTHKHWNSSFAPFAAPVTPEPTGAEQGWIAKAKADQRGQGRPCHFQGRIWESKDLCFRELVFVFHLFSDPLPFWKASSNIFLRSQRMSTG